MALRKKDRIIYEKAPYWVLQHKHGGYEIYKNGITHSTRCAIIGHCGVKGLERAMDEIDRRIKRDKEQQDA